MPEAQETRKKRTPRDILRIGFLHWGWFVAGFAAFAIAALAAVPHISFFEKKYTGTAIFELRTDAAAMRRRSGEADSFESLRLALGLELKGRPAMERAVRDLDLTRGMPRGSDGELTIEGLGKKQELIKRLQAAVQTGWELQRGQHKDYAKVTVTHEDPELAQDLPNTLVVNYINRISKRIVDDLSDSQGFLEGQVKSIEKRLEGVRKERLEFEETHRGQLPDSPDALEDRLREVSADMDTVRRQQRTARQKLERLEALAKDVGENPDEALQTIMGPNPELARLERELEERKKELQNYQDVLQDYTIVNHMTEEHPKVEALEAKITTTEDKITELEKEIEETPEEAVLEKVYGKGRATENLAMAVAAARSEAEVAESEFERLQGRFMTLQKLITESAPVRHQYEQIQRRLDELEAEKKRWQERLTKVEMDLSAEVAKKRTHLKTTQLAEKQIRPSSPTLAKVLGFPLVGGLVFGAALVFLRHLVDRRVSTSQDAEKMFGVPICGVIAEIVTRRQRYKRMCRSLGGMALMLLLAVAIGIGCLNAALWLQYPEKYEEWKDAPVAYIHTQAKHLMDRAQTKVEREF